jgi:lipoate-protein ligase A
MSDSGSLAAPWRFIPHFQAPGSVQMAVDRWLFEQHHQGQHPPTLRFYTWSPVAISLGYHQTQIPDHWHTLQWQGAAIPLVRRPSGGRAVLHSGDLTYAIVTSGLGGDRIADYQALCQMLIDGWRTLGLPLHYGDARRGYHHQSHCFSLATAADLVTEDGVKLIGSAQLRRGATVLQHGSIRLRPDLALLHQVFPDAEPVAPTLPSSLQALTDEMLRRVVCQAMEQAASQTLGIQLRPQPLTLAEWEQIMAT